VLRDRLTTTAALAATVLRGDYPAEIELLRAFRKGRVLDVSRGSSAPATDGADWGSDRIIRGRVLRLLALYTTDWPIGIRFTIIGARFVETLNLSLLQSPLILNFVNCRFDGHVNLHGAGFAGLEFTRCRVENGLQATNTHIRGNVTLHGAFLGPVLFSMAEVDGQLDCNGSFSDPEGGALRLPSVRSRVASSSSRTSPALARYVWQVQRLRS
jgi:hypothetical protein